ncbi:hypothetical protein AB3N02_13980 [Priestia aryabhattai]|uniref:hypothetical protein n=1 Tax=Priestia aryabhattai TaxID=412384 RepID=UPI00399FFDD5
MNFSLGEMMIISGMTAMVEDEGKHPREVMEAMEKIKRDTFHALLEIHQEVNGGKKK